MDSVSTQHAEAAIEVADAMPAGRFVAVREMATSIGSGLWSLIAFLSAHPEWITKIASDYGTQNWNQLVEDIKAAYEAWQS